MIAICEWCSKPAGAKAYNLDMFLRDGRRVVMHGSCAADVVARALDARAKNELENGRPAA